MSAEKHSRSPQQQQQQQQMAQPEAKPFRFLNQEQFSELSEYEKKIYVQRAYEELHKDPHIWP